ncbi:hypothetical protein EMCRGX_G031878 [Ephydatia muelleri]
MASWFSPIAVDFAGESLEQAADDSISSSPVSSTETEDTGTSSGKSSRPPVQLLPLDELGVVGACRRGRRKGQRNRTPAQRVMEAEGKRTEKNIRERMRVEHVRDEYLKLQVLLGFGNGKSVNKLETLNAAIAYIKKLRKLLNSGLQGEENGKECALPTLPTAPSEGHVAQENQQETPETFHYSGDKRTENSFLLELETDAQEANYLLDTQLADLPDGNNFEDIYFEGDQQTQAKVRELAATIMELSVEAQRLRNNLNRLHELQASLLIVSEQFANWMERADVAEKR